MTTRPGAACRATSRRNSLARTTPARRAVGLAAALTLSGGTLVGVTVPSAHAEPQRATFSGTVDHDTGTTTPRTGVHAISVSEAGPVTASVSWTGAADLDLVLKDGSGAQVAVAQTRSGTGPEQVTFDAPAAGTYRFNVFAFTGGADYALDVDFPGQAVVVRPEETAPTDTFNGSLSSTGTKFAQHQIVLSRAGTISATLDWSTTSAKLSLSLRKPDGTVAAATGTRPKFVTFEAPAAGTYKLNVSASSGASPYSLAVSYPKATATGALASYDASYGFSGPAGLYAYGLDWDRTTDTILTGDYWNYRIKRFTTAGAKTTPHVVSVTKPLGKGGGTTAPYDVETDLNDLVGGQATLWSADQGSSRIVQFTQDGRWLQTIGRTDAGEPTGTDAAHPGRSYAAGCDGGRMTIPTHIYADEATGRLYVSDPMCRAVFMFEHNGDFLGKLNWTGSGFGAVIPRGVAEYGGEIYVVEFNTRSINVFGKDGAWRRTIVRQSDMNDPRGLDIDQRNGDIVVVAAYRNEIFKFTKAGALIRKWGTVDGTATGTKFDAIRYPAVDGDGNIYVGETWGTRSGAPGSPDYTGYGVLKFGPNGNPLPFATGPAGPPDGGYNQQNGIALDSTGKLHVVDTFEQRVQTFDTARTCPSVGNCAAWTGQFGSREAAGTQSKGFGYPRALTYGAERDLIYVGDNNNAVLAWRPDGTFVHRFGSQGKGTGQFSGGVQGVRVTGGKV